jgi:hypothetical protein
LFEVSGTGYRHLSHSALESFVRVSACFTDIHDDTAIREKTMVSMVSDDTAVKEKTMAQ